MDASVRWISIQLTGFILLVILLLSCHGEKCGSPPVPRNARISSGNVTLTPGSTVVYSCDPGYELFGMDTIICSNNGQWKGEEPLCAVNVAYRKPANQSTTVRGGDASNANDGNLNTLHDGKYCTETRKETSPWWRVDLLRPYDVRAIRVISPSGPNEIHDLEIRVGNSTTISRNRLCAWQPGNLEAGVKQDFNCARASIGRYVFLQLVGVDGALSVCEVQVFTTDEISAERCQLPKSGDTLRSFNSVCYEFQMKQGSDFDGARKQCQLLGGDLLHDIKNVTKNFIDGELEMFRPLMPSQLVWIGANKEPGLISRTWHWVGGGAVAKPMWGPDQPNNYNGEQNCVVLDGGRGWLWNDVGCNLNYLPWVCQYDPPSCGSADKNVNTTIESSSTEYSIGHIIKYKCPIDSMVVGNDTRVCLQGGSWSGLAPVCKYVDCGPLPQIINGRIELLSNRTTFNATAKFVCSDNYTMKGEALPRCGPDGRWSGDVPSCLFKFCAQPDLPFNGTMNLTKGLEIDSVAIYSCNAGHRMIGQTERKCLIGGKWTGSTPRCKYTDCREPPPIAHGIFVLPYNSTLYNSEVVYICSEDYALKGPSKRTCLENSTWSDRDPYCEIISCGQPEVRLGSYVVVDDVTVRSIAEYFCEPGHVMDGQSNRTCEHDGKWSGDVPRCRFIECGRVQPVPHGQVDYVNSTTHLNSIVSYSCAPGYQLNGNGTRVCEMSGRWSGSTPFCEEIRCREPTRPPNSILSVSGNDRFGDGDTFKVGSTVQFRCEKGYITHGGIVVTCERNGIWSGALPDCKYVDCLYPEPIDNGEVFLLSNTTYYASVAEYVCKDHYEPVGNAKRSCLENGTWNGRPPKCQEINCGAPDKPPSVHSISVVNYTVDSTAVYHCSPGQKTVGNNTRICLRSGQWSDTSPSCEWIDCGRPVSPQNGEIYLLNQSTTYMSVMEYHCFFGYKLVGPAIRTCKEDGQWSETDSKCELDTTNTDVLGENSLTKPVASAGEETEGDIVMSKTIGVAIGVGAGGVLLLTIIIALVYMKLRRPKPTIMSGETLQVRTTTPLDISHPIAAYANMETDLSSEETSPTSAPPVRGSSRVGYPLPELPTRSP